MESKNKVKINVPWKSLFDSTVETVEDEEYDDLSNEQYIFSEKSPSSSKDDKIKRDRHSDILSSNEKSHESRKGPKKMKTREKVKKSKGDQEIDDNVEKEKSLSKSSLSQLSPFYFFIYPPTSLKSFTSITPEEMKKKWDNQKSFLTKDYKNKHKSALKLKKKHKLSSKRLKS